MGIFSIKRTNKSKEKTKESSVIEGKSKNIFHFPSIFKHSNKKKNNKENNVVKNQSKKEQGYYFISYSKSMEISRASTHINNQNNLVNNSYYDTKTIELIKTTMNPISSISYEDQINNRKRKIKEINSSDPEIKRIHSNQSLKEDYERNNLEEKSSITTSIDRPLEEKIDDNLSKNKLRHQSTMTKLNEFLSEGKKNGLVDISSYDEELEYTSYTDLSSKEKSTLLNTEDIQQNVEVIRVDDLKQTEPNHTPTSTQVTLGKDSSLTNTLTSEMTSLNSDDENEIKRNNNNINNINKDKTKQEEITDSNININENSDINNDIDINIKENSKSDTITASNSNIKSSCTHEKRKRGDSYSISPSQGSTTYVQEKRFKKDDVKGSKDLNFVKNHKKRMGIITRSCGPAIRDASVVQGVKGPWRIIETTTLTAGIATSPEIIHQAFGNNISSQIKPMIFRSPSLPSLNTTLSNTKNIITRHQIMSDSLLNEYDSVQKQSLPSSFNGNDSISDDEGSDISGSLNYFSTGSKYKYDQNQIIDEEKSSKNSLPINIKKSSPKLIIQNLKNKSLKAVLKHDTKKLSQNNGKRSPRVKISDLSNPSLQSHPQSISTSTNTITSTSNININTIDTNNNEKDIQTVNSNINTNSNISPISTSTTTNIIINDINSNTNTNTDTNININTNTNTNINTNTNTNININTPPIINVNTNINNINTNTNNTVIPNDTNVKIDDNNSNITTTEFRLQNQSNSITLFQDSTMGSFKVNSSSMIKEELTKDSIESEPQEKSSLTILKYHLNKPLYLENDNPYNTKSNWNNSMTMEARYFITSDNKKRNDHENSSYNGQHQRQKEEKNNYAYGRDTSSSQTIEDEHSTSNISFLGDSSQEQLQSLEEIVNQVNSNKKGKGNGSYSEEIKPILEMARKRKSSERRRKWPKKLRSNENLGSGIQESIRYEQNDSTMSYNNDNMTTMATITSLDRNDQKQKQKQKQNQDKNQDKNQYQDQLSQNDSLYDNYNLGLSFINSESNNDDHYSPRHKYKNPHRIKNTVDIDPHPKIIEIHDIYNYNHHHSFEEEEEEEEEKENISNNNIIGNDNRKKDRNRNSNKYRIKSKGKNKSRNKNEDDKVKGKEVEDYIEEEEEGDDDDLRLREEKNEGVNIGDTTFTSLEFKDTVISSVENDIASSNNNNNNNSTFILKHINSPLSEISMDKLSQKNSYHSKRKASSIRNKNFPRIIDVPQNSSMKKVYAMENIDEEEYNTTFLNYSCTGATAADDTIHSIHIPPTTPFPENSIHILTSQSTQKTSTYNYLPKDLFESNENINITNFQIHTCKDSVLSPLIPCVACSNENKWKNKKFTSKLRQHFKKWIFSITNSKHRDNKSTIYTSSATLSIPIYFGDQLVSPEDQHQHRHHHRSNDSNKIGSGSSSSKSSLYSKKWKSKNNKNLIKDSSPYLFPNKVTQNPLPIQYNSVMKSPSTTIPNYNCVIETKKTESEILPIANDINKKNSSVRIRRTTSKSKSKSNSNSESNLESKPESKLESNLESKPELRSKSRSKSKSKSKSEIKPKTCLSVSTPENIPLSTSQSKTNLSSNKHQNNPKIIKRNDYNDQNGFDKEKSLSSSQARIHYKLSENERNKHKGLIYYNNSRQNLEKDAISHQGSAPNLALENSIELKKRYNNKVSVHEGYNESIFSSPITPELQPMELDDDINNSLSYSSTVSTNLVTINSNSSIPAKKSNCKRHSQSLQSLYKDICVLGLSLERLAEKYSTTNLNRKK